MKFRISLIFAFILTILFAACGPSVEEAIKYNDAIVNQGLKVINKIDTLNINFATYDPAKIVPALDAAKKQAEISLGKISKMEDFQGNPKFRDAAIVYLTIVNNALNKEFNEMSDIYQIPDTLFTESNEKRWNELSNSIDKTLTDSYYEYIAAQKEFALKYNMPLIDAEDIK